MKKHILFLIGLVMASAVFAQAPPTFSFQAVIRDTNNQVVANSQVGMTTTILQGSQDGTIIYREIYHPNPTTNINGLITLQVGNGITLMGNFESIDWSDGPYFIQTEADPTGGTNYTITGVTQLMSVPYALHAKTVDSMDFDFDEEDPIFLASPASEILSEDVNNWDAAFDWGDHGEEGYLTEENLTLANVLLLGNDANENQIKNLGEPTDSKDATTKSYVDLLKDYIDVLVERIEALEIETGMIVKDIDGNTYNIVTIGHQTWMAENLRVSKYNNGDDIPTGLSDADWSSTTSGAYAIYPHGSIDGLGSDAEVVAAYGKLYNWYAVDDSRSLCPAGWSVSSDADWTQLVNYVVAQGYPNDSADPNGSGNALKSCRQVGSPIDGDCATSEHPRWNSDGTHHGFDEFGFSALPGGFSNRYGNFSNVGFYGRWWSATEVSGTNAWFSYMGSYGANVLRSSLNKKSGFSVRCVRQVTDEPATTYNLQLEASPVNAGSVSGAGEYEAGEMIEIDAVANEGWLFVNWTDPNSNLISEDAYNEIEMPADDITLIANFQQEAGTPVIYSVIDIDGNAYPTIVIGNQVWMAENLRVTKYSNGDPIPNVTGDVAWAALTTGAYCWYENNQSANAKYGALYNWHAVNDPRGICPAGWRVPTDAEWTAFTDMLGGAGVAGGKLKATSPLWNDPNIDATNSTGFSALPGGGRNASGSFLSLGTGGLWWSSTEYSSTYAWYRGMYHFGGFVYRGNYYKTDGFSLRCVRDID